MKLLKDRGYKRTEPRIFILACLIANEDRLIAVSTIHRFLSRMKTSISIDTIYRTLTIFEQAGFIMTSTYNGKLHVWLKRETSDNQPVFICTSCNKVTPLTFTQELVDEIEFEKNIKKFILEIYGICPSCKI